MVTEKVVKLSHVTLEPNMLFGKRDAIATHGNVYAQAAEVMRIDSKEYAESSAQSSSDLAIGQPALAQLGCDLFVKVAQLIANESGAVVEYLVAGEVRRVLPAAK